MPAMKRKTSFMIYYLFRNSDKIHQNVENWLLYTFVCMYLDRVTGKAACQNRHKILNSNNFRFWPLVGEKNVLILQ